MPDNLDSVFSELERIEDAVGLIHRDAQADLAGGFYADVVETSPVLTGAYRATHIAAEGFGSPSTNIYESEERPGSDDPYAGPLLSPPDPSAAAAAFKQLEPGATMWVYNSRFYSQLLEYGTALMEPRLIYESASVRAEARAERLAAALSARIIK